MKYEEEVGFVRAAFPDVTMAFVFAVGLLVVSVFLALTASVIDNPSKPPSAVKEGVRK